MSLIALWEQCLPELLDEATRSPLKTFHTTRGQGLPLSTKNTKVGLHRFRPSFLGGSTLYLACGTQSQTEYSGLNCRSVIGRHKQGWKTRWHWFCLLRSVIGPENSRHSVNQSDAKLKPIITCLRAFTRVSERVFNLSSDWLLVMISPSLQLADLIILVWSYDSQ